MLINLETYVYSQVLHDALFYDEKHTLKYFSLNKILNENKILLIKIK